MDYDNIKNLSKTAMENKVIYTKKLLGRKVAIELKSLLHKLKVGLIDKVGQEAN